MRTVIWISAGVIGLIVIAGLGGLVFLKTAANGFSARADPSALETIANCQHHRRKIAWHLQATKEGAFRSRFGNMPSPSTAEPSYDRESRKTCPGGGLESRLTSR